MTSLASNDVSRTSVTDYLLNLTRWKVWYRSKVPLFMVCMYYAALTAPALHPAVMLDMAALLLLLCILAAFGHMANSLSDQDIDKAAGKHCPFASVSTLTAQAIVGFTAALGLGGAVLLYFARPDVLILWCAAFALAMFYSLPPLRLKERGTLGILAASVAQRTLPAIIIFQTMAVWDWAAVGLTALGTILGLKAILQHQLHDNESDSAAGVRTFVVNTGESFSRRLLHIVFTLEVLTFLSTVVLMSLKLPPVAIAAALYMVWISRRALLGRETFRQIPTPSLNVFTNFYDLLWPMFLAVLLVARNPAFWIVLLASYLWLYSGNEAKLIRRLRGFFSSARAKASNNMGDLSLREMTRFLFPPKSKMIDRPSAEQALQRGLASLPPMQRQDGSFPLAFRVQGREWQSCHPIFSTLMVLLAVGPLLPAAVVESAVQFILGCRRQDGLWEFDPALGIPTDTDTTSCSLAVLARHGSGLTSSADAAILRSFWREDAGPFRTWSDKTGMWHLRNRDDAVVNANVLMALNELRSPATTTEIEAVLRLVQETRGRTRYYCTPATTAYALCRGGIGLDQLPKRLIRRPRFRTGILPTAQWLSAVRRWDNTAVASILAVQSSQGSWPEEGCFTAAAEIPTVWGSPAVTTALCAEALSCALAPPAGRVNP